MPGVIVPGARNKSIFISAGETSGDTHAAEMIHALKQISVEFNLTISGLGGEKLEAEGVNLLYRTNDLAAIGYIEVIKKLSFFKQVLKDCLDFVKQNDPAAVILVDYPGFNLRFAEELRKFYDKKIIYYISPQLWAWHKNRVYKIKKFVDKILVVFPFETEFYGRYGVKAEYVGHPLVSRVKNYLQQHSASVEKGSISGEKVITVLPGSRKDEIKHHLPIIIEILRQLGKEFKLKVNISKAPGLDDSIFTKYKDELKNYNLTSGNVYDLMLNSDIVLTKAGTSTMECSLIGTPYLIFYRTVPLNYYLLKPVVKIENLGIANILSKKNIVKEFVQNDFTPEKLLPEIRKILTDESYRKKMIESLKGIWNILGESEASLNAAKIIKQTALAN